MLAVSFMIQAIVSMRTSSHSSKIKALLASLRIDGSVTKLCKCVKF